MLTKEIYPQDCVVIKSGKTGDGRDWSLYKITDQDKVEFTSFNPLSVGIKAEINYTEEGVTGRDGRIFTNRKIVPSTQVKKIEEKERLYGQLDRIEQGIGEIIKLLLK